MLMYRKDSDVAITVDQAQVKVLERSGWTKEPGKEKPEVPKSSPKAPPSTAATATATKK